MLSDSKNGKYVKVKVLELRFSVLCNNKEAGNTEVLLNSRYNDYGGEAFWGNI